MTRKKILTYSLSAVAVLAIVLLFVKYDGGTDYDPSEEIQEEQPALKYGLMVDSLTETTASIKRGQTLSTIFAQEGLGYSLLEGVLENSKEVFDIRKIQENHQYHVFRKDSVPVAFVYDVSALEYVRFNLTDGFLVEKGTNPVDTIRKYSEARIESSLWNAMAGSGINPMVSLELSEVFAWTIDFFGLQKDDAFQVIYEEYEVEGKSVGLGRIIASRFDHSGKTYYGFRYVQDTIPNYWDENGQNLRKQFLKAPLRYSRISSGFSYARRHPVLKTVRAHTAIDYAAPAGTPVMSIGEGTVIERSYSGGNGNMVKIRHNGTYTSAYLHLSKFGPGIQKGTRVTQGQIIGYVGSTGLSTGPHLDFRVWKDGVPINPLKMDSPPAEPIHDSDMEAYREYTWQWSEALQQKSTGQGLEVMDVELYLKQLPKKVPSAGVAVSGTAPAESSEPR